MHFLLKWRQEIERYACENVPVMMVGTRADAPNRVVEQERAKQLALEMGCSFGECSARTGPVDDVFFKLAARIYKGKSDDDSDVDNDEHSRGGKSSGAIVSCFSKKKKKK